MTPGQWVEERAKEWAEWVEKTLAGQTGYRSSSSTAEYGGGGELRGQGIDYVIFDHLRCAEFEAAVSELPDYLRVVFKMHWLGSDRPLPEARPADSDDEHLGTPADTSVAIKAGMCGISRRGYYRRLDEANGLLYAALH